MTHKHNLFDVLDQKLIKQMVVSMIKLNYIWTRIGTKTCETEDKIGLIQYKLNEVMQQFVDQEESHYRTYCRQLRRLEEQLESVFDDMKVIADENELQLWIKSLSKTSGLISKQLDNCLRSQINYLHKRYRSLVKHRDQHLLKFDSIKNSLEFILNSLGLTKLADSRCEELRGKRVINCNEMKMLLEEMMKYRKILEQRKIVFQDMSREICGITKLVPMHIEDDYLLKEEDKNICTFVFSEPNQAKLTKLHHQITQSANKIWLQLVDEYEKLSKLYELFELDQDLRHPYFNEIAQMKCSVNGLKEKSLPWKQLYLEQNVTLLEAIKEIQLEHEQYLSLKKERMIDLVDSIRSQISTILAECLVQVDSLQTDMRFKFLFTDSVNEDMFRIHEKELQRLKQYHAKYEHIFSLVLKWRKLKTCLLECDQLLQNGTNYRNRGAILQQILVKQRTLKKRLAHSEQQIHLWLQQNNKQHQQTANSSDDDLLPFNLYNLSLEDLAQEVNFPTYQQQLQYQTKSFSKSIRQTSNLSMTTTTIIAPYTPIIAKRITSINKHKLFSDSRKNNNNYSNNNNNNSRLVARTNNNNNNSSISHQVAFINRYWKQH